MELKCPKCGDTRVHNVNVYWWECSCCNFEFINEDVKDKAITETKK